MTYWPHGSGFDPIFSIQNLLRTIRAIKYLGGVAVYKDTEEI